MDYLTDFEGRGGQVDNFLIISGFVAAFSIALVLLNVVARRVRSKMDREASDGKDSDSGDIEEVKREIFAAKSELIRWVVWVNIVATIIIAALLIWRLG